MMIWKNSSWYGRLVHGETSRRPTAQLQTGRSRTLVCFMQLPRAPGLRARGSWRNISPGQSCKSRDGVFWFIPRHNQLDPSNGLMLGDASNGSSPCICTYSSISDGMRRFMTPSAKRNGGRASTEDWSLSLVLVVVMGRRAGS